MSIELNTNTQETPRRNSRAEQARINGAKSRGPKTAAGKARIRRANWKHGAYAVNATVLAIECVPAFNSLRDSFIAQYAPKNALENQIVEEIVDYTWRILRFKAASTTDLEQRIRQLCAAQASGKIRWDLAMHHACTMSVSENSVQDRLERSIRNWSSARSKLLNDLAKLRELVPASGISQDLLYAKDLPEIESQELPQIDLV